MSWQRIFEVARGRGLPIVVTDLAGREPMVMMPLEEYENLISQGQMKASPSLAEVKSKPEVIPVEEINVAIQEAVAKEGLSLEEKFYLEPLEEGS